ncbi:MAG: hypothetical protein KTR35_01745 [Gammaproteobacteria bacterium]|nr:hypothetical protein [Gammaproteobacteria bacterium]
MESKKYQKRDKQIVLAVQIDLDIVGFSYVKWGSEQRCQARDWLVNNNGECYTISEDSFRNTYEEIAPAQYVKTAPVWATQATRSGKVKTREGYTEYSKGDYLVSNNCDGTDAYAVSKDKFEYMYELIESDS